MAIVISTSSTTPLSLLNNDTIYFTSAGSLINTTVGTSAITSSGASVNNSNILIDGTVVNLAVTAGGLATDAIVFGTVASFAASNFVKIGEAGVLRSTGGGIKSDATSVRIDNFGLIDTEGTAISLVSGQVLNAGVIRSGGAGILYDGGGGLLQNSGDIFAGTAGMFSTATTTGELTNSGTIRASTAGMGFSGGNQNITNSGDIFSFSNGISAQSFGFSAIQNSGSVTGEIGIDVLTGTTLFLFNQGDIYGEGRSIRLRDLTGGAIQNSGNLTSASIGVEATVTSGFHLDNSGKVDAASNAVKVTGNQATVSNTGALNSVFTDAIAATGFGFTLRNSGNIDAAANGLTYVTTTANGGTITVSNLDTGHISGGNNGLFLKLNDDAVGGERALITNAGVIEGRLSGISATGLPLVVMNSGSITASAGVALDVDGEQNSRITNTGVIAAALPVNTGTAMAIDLKGALGGGNGTLRNFGDIIGDVQMGDQTDVVRNQGLIDGDLRLDGGDDVFDGRGGSLTGTVDGGAGNDTFYIDQSDLTVTDTAGTLDTLWAACSYRLGTGIETLAFLGQGDYRGWGTTTANTIDGNLGDNRLSGLDGNDTMRGNQGDDTLVGGGGNDTILGGDGDDALSGGTGNDTTRGEDGNDLLTSDAGTDLLAGGAGLDRFVLSSALHSSAVTASADIISDFVRGEDKIDLSALDAIATNANPDDAFVFIGSAAFSNVAGQLRYVQTGGHTNLEMDLDGGGSADVVLRLFGTINVTVSDFVL